MGSQCWQGLGNGITSFRRIGHATGMLPVYEHRGIHCRALYRAQNISVTGFACMSIIAIKYSSAYPSSSFLLLYVNFAIFCPQVLNV
jgi:hypothetical protein